MSDHPLAYLLDRFATDATTLRERAAHLKGKPAPPHGPDAAASLRMADACESVLRALQPLAGHGIPELLEALEALGPELEAQSTRASDAFVRSVFAGAATRITEIRLRTQQALDDDAASGPDEAEDDALDGDEDEAFGDDELDDELDEDEDDDLDEDDGEDGRGGEAHRR